jgi:hypothetical protein
MAEVDVFAVGPCARCTHPFAYDPVTVASVWCDIRTGIPHDPVDEYQERRPLCPLCAPQVNAAAHLGGTIDWPAARTRTEPPPG